MDTTAKTLVIGLGNALLSDLGAGIEIIHLLRHRHPRGRCRGVDLVRAGLVNVSLAQVIGRYLGLIVVECRPVGGAPGSVVELHGERMDQFLRQQTGDDAALADILGLLQQSGGLPEYRSLIALQPSRARLGRGLSPQVEAAVPLVAERILSRAGDWRHAAAPELRRTATGNGPFNARAG